MRVNRKTPILTIYIYTSYHKHVQYARCLFITLINVMSVNRICFEKTIFFLYNCRDSSNLGEKLLKNLKPNVKKENV